MLCLSTGCVQMARTRCMMYKVVPCVNNHKCIISARHCATTYMVRVKRQRHILHQQRYALIDSQWDPTPLSCEQGSTCSPPDCNCARSVHIDLYTRCVCVCMDANGEHIVMTKCHQSSSGDNRRLSRAVPNTELQHCSSSPAARAHFI